ncbi:hypothetical protein M427DRAFT_30568 [Gonapodya prolifera JEL478]|uniref:Uncharacterized protein n=1 Tax=Gonapodya prolifera (strain JEL478) TaxID=1344416 RepID=A0A139AL08_GONPJ|nr:hypothetical protein M427DRAFT_30568 [Gonapodya prolifera JEL478]|eukprot:KXS17456.1 hypothetical protein M427DRAFT_30568 [Gonapodya prolifera JEL478]
MVELARDEVTVDMNVLTIVRGLAEAAHNSGLSTASDVARLRDQLCARGAPVGVVEEELEKTSDDETASKYRIATRAAKAHSGS